MNKFVFTFFLLISPILLCGQNILNVFVGDTIVFSGIDGTRDCFFYMSSLEKYNFSNKNKFEVEDGSTSYNSVEHCWLRVDSIISHKKDILVVFDRIKDGQKFVMKLPPIKKVPESSFLQNHIKCYDVSNSKKVIRNYYYELSCEKKSYYDNLIFELQKTPLLPIADGIFKAFDKYVFKSYLLEQVPIKVRFEINGTTEVDLGDYEINQLLTKKKGREARIAAFNNSVSKKYNIDSINELKTNLIGKKYWINSLIFKGSSLETESSLDAVHYLSFKYTNTKQIVRCDRCDYKTYELVNTNGYLWPNGGSKSVWGEVTGGVHWNFLRGKLIDIKLLTTKISIERVPKSYYYTEEKRVNRKRELLDLWGDYNYYMIIVPDSTETYGVWYDYDLAQGKDIIDTLFIPYSSDKLSYIYTDKQMDSLEKAFNSSLQKQWEEADAKNERRYKTAVKLFGKAIADVVCEGEVQLGYTTEMCSFAYEGEPYHESYETIPIGTFLCRVYYESGVKLYFKNNQLVLIQWIE